VKTLGPEHTRVGHVLVNLGHLESRVLNFAEAERLASRSLAIQEKALGAENPALVESLQVLVVAAAGQGRAAEAEARYRRALDIASRGRGPTHPRVGLVELDYGDALRALGRPREALAHYARSRGVLEPKLARNHYYLGLLYAGTAEAHLAVKEAAAAVGPAEQALAAFEAEQGNPEDLARARSALARALLGSGKDRARALSLAQAARAALDGRGPHVAAQLAELTGYVSAAAP
jgi:eukaryotic-like serine/threonine-protein kinase